MWIWQHNNWPTFRYDLATFSGTIADFNASASRLAGCLDALAESSRQEVTVDLMVSEAIKTMEIEGEHLDRESVVNSIAVLMGFVPGKGLSWDRKAEGVAQLMTDVRMHWNQALTHELLFAWQEAVVPTSRLFDIKRGAYRADEMQIVSGAIGQLKINYQAPPPNQVHDDMERFIDWYNNARDEPSLPGPIRAGIAHVWFEAIHPFDDGNGRVGRAIADQALSQGLGFPTLGCLATAIEKNKKAYYAELTAVTEGDGDLQQWLGFFTRMAAEAQQLALKQVDFVLDKARFYDRFGDQLNERQGKVIGAMFRRGQQSIEQGLTPKKYIKIAKCPERTAHRDIAGLVKLRAIAKVPGTAGRSTRYALTRGNSPTIGGNQHADFEKARQLFQQSGIEGTLYPANPSIRYDGLIAAANDQHVIQQIASRTYVAHEAAALHDRPIPGSVVSIHKGHVATPDKTQQG